MTDEKKVAEPSGASGGYAGYPAILPTEEMLKAIRQLGLAARIATPNAVLALKPFRTAWAELEAAYMAEHGGKIPGSERTARLREKRLAALSRWVRERYA